MKKILLMAIFASALCACCGNTGTEAITENPSRSKSVLPTPALWDDFYKKVDPRTIDENPIQLIGQEWMLITAGDEASYNTMTASWGALGEIWSRPVAIITVRNIRYTNEFLERNDTFTLSFYHEDYKEALALLGSKSGRDTDKVAESGLTPVATPEGSMSFGEAWMVLECRKLYAEPMGSAGMIAEIADRWAAVDNEYHILYIGEILAAWVKK